MQYENAIRNILKNEYRKTVQNADVTALYNAVAKAALYRVQNDWDQCRLKQSKKRRACYLSAEFLIGRLIYSNLLHLGLLDETAEYLAGAGRDIREFEQIEDAALGNGGLGRLAACFLDAAAQQGKPLTGYGIRYKYGLFRQAIENGAQQEFPDDWQRFGDPFAVRRPELRYQIPFKDGVIYAVAYDLPVIPYGNAGCINTLRLFEAESDNPFDFALFNAGKYAAAVRGGENAARLHYCLYPNDAHKAGRLLRLRQEYFFTSAAIQDMLRAFEQHIGADLVKFCDYFAVQLNDTHPVLAILELIYRLTQRGMDFETAAHTAQKTFRYTNHTVLPEALEQWDAGLFKSALPHLYKIADRLNKQMVQSLFDMGIDKDRINRMQILCDGRVHMANLAVYMSEKVNGVARLHTEILKERVLADWNAIDPHRIVNCTNGVTQRRWLRLCNPGLSALITEKIGDGWITDFRKFEALAPYAADPDFQSRFIACRQQNKQALCDWLRRQHGIELSADAAICVQAKRLHEYKRQLLGALGALYLYFGVKDGSITLPCPVTTLFAAKAAPGYIAAKEIIRLIHHVAKIIEQDKQVSRQLRVVFVPNYNVSVAEKLIPAADLSEQLSTAGFEASGTGNMKFMLNGTPTLGTYDGANIEIVQAAGEENNYIFGMRADEVQAASGHYEPKKIYQTDERIKRAVDPLQQEFSELFAELLQQDRYFVLADLNGYVQKKLQALEDYANHPAAYAEKCIQNMAAAGRFSADRTILEYCADIWQI